MEKGRLAVIWPSEENWPAFRDACDDEVHATHAEFVASATPKLQRYAAHGNRFVKIDPDVAAMVAWCRVNGGKVDAKNRALFAALVIEQQSKSAD